MTDSLLQLTRRALDVLEDELRRTRNMWAAYNAAKRVIAWPREVDPVSYRHLCETFRDIAELEAERLFPEPRSDGDDDLDPFFGVAVKE